MTMAIVLSICASRITQEPFDSRLMSRYSCGFGNMVTHVRHDEGGVTVLIHCRTPNPSWYHIKEKSTEPDDGESIVRARSRYNALLFHAYVACPDREPMICFPSTRYEENSPR
jgi:hypothetical protein